MPIKSIGGRDFEIGVLDPDTVTVSPEPAGAFYSMLTGKNPSGETRHILTRGAGKRWAATCVPLLISSEIAEMLQEEGVDAQWSYDDVIIVLANHASPSGIKVLLAQMPREGVVESGWEWDALGGTQELGEAPQDIAAREFHEESGLVPLWMGTNFPDYNMAASGCYDEVQKLFVALVTEVPTVLVEGARRWISVPLHTFKGWAKNQNQLEYPELWDSKVFCPVDFKVYSLARSFAADLDRECVGV